MSTLHKGLFVLPSPLAHLSMLISNNHLGLILQRQLGAIIWKIPLSQILMDNFVAFCTHSFLPVTQENHFSSRFRLPCPGLGICPPMIFFPVSTRISCEDPQTDSLLSGSHPSSYRVSLHLHSQVLQDPSIFVVFTS